MGGARDERSMTLIEIRLKANKARRGRARNLRQFAYSSVLRAEIRQKRSSVGQPITAGFERVSDGLWTAQSWRMKVCDSRSREGLGKSTL